MAILLDLLFPRHCLGCDTLLYGRDYEKGFCPECNKLVVPIGDGACIKCGKKMKNLQAAVCKDCRKKRHYFTQGKALYWYKQPMKDAMYRLKYSNRRCDGAFYGAEGARRYGRWMREIGIDVLVPIPMYKRKERRRGYNQASVVAKELGKAMGLPVDTKMVVREHNTRPQKGLSESQRKNNLKNAFKIRNSDVKLKKILLIDDIYTTGSTMDEVSRILLAAGAAEVYCLSICAGEDADDENALIEAIT